MASAPDDMTQQLQGSQGSQGSQGGSSGLDAGLGADSMSMFQQLQQTEQQQQGIAVDAANNTLSQEQQIKSMKPPGNRGMLAPMPFLLALTALGGATSGLHGRVMLGALAGMAKGAINGHELGVQDAMKSYKENWQKMTQLFALQNQYYNELYQAYGKTAEGQAQAIEMVEKITNDQVNQNINIQKLGLSRGELYLKRQALMQQVAALGWKKTFQQAQLALQKQKLWAALQQNILTPEQYLILGKVQDRIGVFPAGFGVSQLKAKVEGELAAHPGEKPDQIADALVRGFIHGKVLNSAMTTLGRREANVDAAMQTIVAPGGNLDQAIQYAKAAGLGNNKPVNWAAMKASEYQNNPAMRQFIQAMGELRSDVSQSFARGGLGNVDQQKKAEKAVPDVVTLQELEGMKTSIPALAGAAMQGTLSAEQNIMEYGPGGTDENEGGTSMAPAENHQEGDRGTLDGKPVIWHDGAWWSYQP